MIAAFQYKLYPTKQQELTLLQTLETLRHLYNNALGERIDAFKHVARRSEERATNDPGSQRSINCCDQQYQLPTLKKSAPPLKNINAQVTQNCLQRLQRAYENFFRRVKLGLEEPGFPRFKGIGRYRLLTYPQCKGVVTLCGPVLHLPKIGDIPVRVHRPLEGTPKTCTISRKADGWYCSITCEVEAEPLPKTGADVGIDVGITDFATLSDDHESITNPRLLKKAHKHLAMCQRRLERRSKYNCQGRCVVPSTSALRGTGKQRKLLAKQSRRREKAKILLAKAHQRVARTRLDFQHKVAYQMVRRFDTIYVEKLNIVGMLKNHHLARAISDVAWGQFFSVLSQKAESAAKHVVEVCPRNTSQNCSGCGEYVPKALSVRTHTCPYCGLVLHRDKNAAENIKKVGSRKAETRSVVPCSGCRIART